jgi:hypothetical protein
MVTSLHYARATRLHKLDLDALLRSAAVEAIRATRTKECGREKRSKTNQSQSRRQFAAGLTPVSSASAPALKKQSEHHLTKVEEALPATNRSGESTNDGAACFKKEFKLRLTRVEETLPTQSRESGRLIMEPRTNR